MTTRPRTKKRKQQEKAQPDKNLERPEVNPDERTPFDFGGLPKRDLKKNLGCG